MLFHVTYRPKAGYTHEDQKMQLKLWENWSPPEGYEIKAFHVAPDGRGFALAESATAEALVEAASLWGGVYIDFDIVPVVEVGKAVEATNKAIATRESA